MKSSSDAAAQAVTLTRPQLPALPIVVDSPHSGHAWPADFRSRLTMDYLRGIEDCAVDQLYASAPRHGATLIAADFPRGYIDPNRSLDDIDQALLDAPWPGPVQPSRKTELGAGLVWRLIDGEPVYDAPLAVAEVQRRIDRCWKPYHAALQQALDEALTMHGRRWHLNVHSMGDHAYERLGLPVKPLADVVLGTLDGSTCDADTVAVVADAFRASGLSVAVDDPFKGVEIIRASGDPARGCQALQIEVKKSLYWNDATQAPGAGFARIESAIDTMLAALAAHVRAVLAR